MKEHMDAVRGVTGTSGLLSMAMATDALNGTERIAVHVQNPITEDIDLNEIDDTSLSYLVPHGGVSKNAPLPGKWWLVLTAFNRSLNAFQFAVPDDGSTIFLRVKAFGAWTHWTKLGGVTKRLLFSLVPRIGGACYVA